MFVLSWKVGTNHVICLKPERHQSKETKLTYVCPVITFVKIEFALTVIVEYEIFSGLFNLYFEGMKTN